VSLLNLIVCILNLNLLIHLIMQFYRHTEFYVHHPDRQ
jgi:hypothetical protein